MTHTLTRYAILKHGEQVRNIVKFPRCDSYESADRHRREKDAAFPHGAPHRIVRIDMTVTDPAVDPSLTPKRQTLKAEPPEIDNRDRPITVRGVQAPWKMAPGYGFPSVGDVSHVVTDKGQQLRVRFVDAEITPNDVIYDVAIEPHAARPAVAEGQGA